MTELTQEQLDYVRQYLAKQAELKGELGIDHRYYYIEINGFATVTTERDHPHGFDEILEDRLQAWYIVPKGERKALHQDLGHTEEWTHDQYCDWLRRKEL